MKLLKRRGPATFLWITCAVWAHLRLDFIFYIYYCNIHKQFRIAPCGSYHSFDASSTAAADEENYMKTKSSAIYSFVRPFSVCVSVPDCDVAHTHDTFAHFNNSDCGTTNRHCAALQIRRREKKILTQSRFPFYSNAVADPHNSHKQKTHKWNKKKNHAIRVVCNI